MPLGAPIPMPKNFGDSFAEGVNTSQNMINGIMNNRLTPYKMELMKQQAEEAKGNAAKSSMIAHLINQVMGGGGGANADLAAGLLNIPVYRTTMDGKLVTVNPLSENQRSSPSSTSFGTPVDPSQPVAPGYGANDMPSNMNPQQEANWEAGIPGTLPTTQRAGGASIQQIGETPGQKRLGEAEAKASGKALEDIVNTSQVSQKIGESLEGLKSLLKNPNYKNLAGSAKAYAMNAQPLGIPVGAVAQKLFSPEDKEMLGQANSYMGNIVTAYGQLFKGPYKAMINGLINTIKPNINDPFEVQVGKIKALEMVKQLGDKQNSLIEHYIHQGMHPTAAILRASQEIPFSMIKSQVDQQLSSTTKSTPSSSTAGGMVKVRDNHTGKILTMPRDQAEKLMRESQ